MPAYGSANYHGHKAGEVTGPAGYGGGQGGGRARQDADYMRQQAEAAQQRKGEIVYGSGLDSYKANEAQSREQQGAALGMLADSAAGKGMSQAQILGAQQANQAISAQRAMAASARGPQGMAMAQANAAQGASAAQAQIGGQAMAQRAAEIQAAQAQYMQGAGAMRGADLATQAQNAQQLATQAQMNAAQRAQNDQYAQGMYGNEIGINTQQQNAALQQYGQELNYDIQSQQVQNERFKADAEMAKTIMSGMGGFMGAMSDETTKEKVSSAKGSDVKQLLKALGGATYEYKKEHVDKPGAAHGKQYGPASAQKIGATKLGSTFVKRGDDGLLRIEGAGAVKALLGLTAHLSDEIDSLKKSKGKR